jgi:polysaccharide export outer membrane protein
MTRLTKTHSHWAILLLIVGATAQPPVVAAQDGTAIRYEPTRMSEAPLMPGDMIQLHFWREPGLSGDYTVDQNGRVVLPILGARYVTATAPADLQQQLLTEYDRELRNQTVRITLFRRVRILGAVRNPGLYHVDPTMTLGDALALAGGATPDGKLSDIRIMRNHREILAHVDRGSLVAEHLWSGDQILVPERSWLSRNSRILVGGLLSAAAVIVAQAVVN